MNKLTKEERAEVETIMKNWFEWYNINRDGTITELLSVDKNKFIRWLKKKKKEWQEEAIENMSMKEAVAWWLKHYKGIEYMAESGKVKPEVMFTISTILERCFKELKNLD